jgi:hypothetical protein
MLKDPNQRGETRRCILLAMPRTVPGAARGRKAYSRCKQSGRAECNYASKKFRPRILADEVPLFSPENSVGGRKACAMAADSIFHSQESRRECRPENRAFLRTPLA